MDYKQKYEQALERARDSFNYPDMPGFIRADVVFPELKESENERIRRAILEQFKSKVTDGHEDRYFRNGITFREAIDWIEKQGIDILSFPKEHQKYLRKYNNLDRSSLIIMLAERDKNTEEALKALENCS